MRNLRVIVLTWVFCVLCGAAYVFSQESAVAQDGLNIATEALRAHIVELADDKYEGRGAGYKGERKAADYIAREFKKIGLKPVGDRARRSYFQEFKFHPRHPVVPWEFLESRNVLGFLEGTDPVLKDQIIVLGAHYDGQGRTGQADPGRFGVEQAKTAKDDIWNSADDNAASVGAILEIARTIKAQNIAIKRSILFIAFGAEEHGMSGSMYYVSHPVFPLPNHVAMINLEKLGLPSDKPFSLNGSASSTLWKDILKAAQEQTRTQVNPNIPFNVPDSDHYPFSASRIPAVMLYVSASAAHFASDTADRIDVSRVAQGAQFAMSMVRDLGTRENRPEYAASPMPDLGLVAHLATAAEADAKGLAVPHGGLKITGVVPGLPAAAAGLKQGDFVTEFAGYKFGRNDTLAALMAMHREILEGKRGNLLPLKGIRGTQPLDLNLTLRR